MMLMYFHSPDGTCGVGSLRCHGNGIASTTCTCIGLGRRERSVRRQNVDHVYIRAR